MATDVITDFTRVVLANGTARYTYAPGNLTIDQTGDLWFAQVYDIGTTEESITAFGDIADGSEGQIILENLDSTNYVQWGFATTVYGGRMTVNNPRVKFNAEPSLSLFLKANTAACNVLVVCFEV